MHSGKDCNPIEIARGEDKYYFIASLRLLSVPNTYHRYPYHHLLMVYQLLGIRKTKILP